MKKFYVVIVFLVVLSISAAAQQREIIVGQLVRTADPRHPIPGWVNVKVRDEHGIINKDHQQVENDSYTPPATFPNQEHADGISSSPSSSGVIPTTNASFDGQGYQSVCPADPIIATGQQYVVQLINGYSGAIYQAYDKTTHTPVFPTGTPNYMDAITGVGGLGDPIALYDAGTDNFILTELANKNETRSNGLVIVIAPSASMAPGGTQKGVWKSYFFKTTNFPDYPKYALSNGYLYIKTNDFKGQSYSTASVYAVRLADLIAGSSAPQMLHFSLGNANKYYSMCPVNQVGGSSTTFTEGGLFAYLNPGVWNGSSTDYIGLVELNPTASTAKDILSLPVASYQFPASTVPQPNGGEGLDALRYRVMNEPVLRNFTDHQSLVLSFTVNPGTGIDAVRWYELRTNTAATSTSSSARGFTVYQESNVDNNAAGTTAATVYRWMPSINIDGNGNVAIGYNVVNNTNTYPSVRMIGALAPGAATGTKATTTYTAETVLTAGSASSSCSGRYGDYNGLVIDPSNGSSFWLTAMYNASSKWSTTIGAFNITTSVQQFMVQRQKDPGTQLVNPISVFPNPTHDVMKISLSVVQGSTTVIQVVDLSGHVLRQQIAVNGTNQVYLSGLAPSAYLIKVISKDKTSVQRVLKD